MLFRAPILEKIRAGEITLAFRYWRKPTVKAGGTLRTPIGVLAIEAVERREPGDIGIRDVRSAGFETLADLLESLGTLRGGVLYRIRFRFMGDDPRIALRSSAHIPASELSALRERLQRFDATSATGAWTERVLSLIASHDGITAASIADTIRVEKDPLKRNIRKLKELGLTESLPTGYRISPRGRSVLATLAKRK